MIKSYVCPCGNKDPKKAFEYNGALGYEAIVCLVCRRYADHEGQHEADTWSMGFKQRRILCV